MTSTSTTKTKTKSSIAADIAAAIEARKRFCVVGEWYKNLDADDQQLIDHQLGELPCRSVFKAVRTHVGCSEGTWARHFSNHECACYTTGAIHG